LLLPQLGPWYEAGPFAAKEGAALHTAPFWPEASPSGEQDLAAKDATGAWRWRLRPDLGQTGMATFPADVSAVYLYREILTREAGRFAVGLGSDDSLRVWLNGELVHDRDVGRGLVPGEDQLALQLRAGANHLLVKVVNRAGSFAFAFQREDDGPEGFSIAVEHALLLEPGARSTAQQDVLREHFRASESPAWAALRSERDTAARALAEFEATLPTTMVMAERVERRPAQVLQRGQYDRPGETVAPGVPAILPPLPADAPADRLGLARWLVAPGHPLTARVTVNRLWQEHFGIGLVRTSNDFGSQGEFPSHPQLLDWLAVELIESGWDLKHMHRLMVNSATYRQSARMRPELLERDPHNRLLARGPRLRLDAEEIRDAALAVSGLLVETLGGPSVRPYQPPGIWEAVGYVGSNTQKFTPDSGDKLYRRSLYTFWKRTAPPPSMTLFDAPSRETCSLQRARTNTPLQALVVQNDVQFVEAARCLGQRALREGGSDDAARIEFLFRLATARRPDAEERALLLELLGDLRGSYAQDPQAAQALRGVGESPYEAQWEPSELAAWSILASTLLNLDEALTRG
jgi:hypothetical protein